MKDHQRSPLALPFEQALAPSKFGEQLCIAGEEQVREDLRRNSNAALRPAIATAKFALERRGIQVVFEKGIPKGARLMTDKAGKVLPKLVDGKTGQILKTARGVGKAGKAAKAGATAALAIVEVAHIISGHDNAKRLKKVELRVERLVHAHESELKGKLEGIYRHSKELLHSGLDELSAEDKRDLYSQCRELFELRARWRDDFMFRLDHVDKAQPGWFNRLFFWRKDEALARSRHDRAAEANEGLEFVQLMHFSLMLQATLAAVAGRDGQFREATLRDECMLWSSLHDHVVEKILAISDDRLEDFEPFLTGIEDMTMVWSSFALRSVTVVPVKQLKSRAPSNAGKLISAVKSDKQLHDFYIGYPESDGDRIGENYALKVYFLKKLGDNFTRGDLLRQFVVRIHSQTSGRLSRGEMLARSKFRINYNEKTDAHAFIAHLPSLSNGLSEWLHGIEVQMSRPRAGDVFESGRIYRAVRFVRA